MYLYSHPQRYYLYRAPRVKGAVVLPILVLCCVEPSSSLEVCVVLFCVETSSSLEVCVENSSSLEVCVVLSTAHH